MQNPGDLKKLKKVVGIFKSGSLENSDLINAKLPLLLTYDLISTYDYNSFTTELTKSDIIIDYSRLKGKGSGFGRRQDAICTGIIQAVIEGQQNKTYTDSAGNSITIKKPYTDDWTAEGFLRWAISCGLLEYVKADDKCKITSLGEEFYGYHNYYQILSAENYNCPQARPRLFTVSLLSDEPFVFPEKMELIRNLKDIIDKNVNFNEYQPSDAEKEILFQLPDGTWCVKEATKKGYKEIQEYQVVNLAFPNSKTRRGRVGDCAKTVTTSPRQAVFYNGNYRLFTAKEYLLLMGYDEKDYKKMKRAGLTDAQITSLAGNSICVPVLEAIFQQCHKMDII